jgi:transcriptional regulator with AAA-type ATPase domain
VKSPGSARSSQPVDVRLVAATSIDLARVVRAGASTSACTTTCARARWNCRRCARPGDILPLAEYFVGIYSVRLQRPVPLVSEAAQQVRKRILARQYPRAGERHPLCLAGE